MAGPYLPLWQRQRLLASVGAKITTPAPAPPAPAPQPQPQPPDAGTWFTDGLDAPDEPDTTPPWNGEET
jgi:hypothetical protein